MLNVLSVEKGTQVQGVSTVEEGGKKRSREGSTCGNATKVSQTSFGHISINFLMIPTVLMAPKSP